MSSPTAAQNDSIEKKKNPASQIARFGAYPSSRSFLAISVQKFPIIVIIDQARILYLYTYTPSSSINRLSDVLWENSRVVRGRILFCLVWGIEARHWVDRNMVLQGDLTGTKVLEWGGAARKKLMCVVLRTCMNRQERRDKDTGNRCFQEQENQGRFFGKEGEWITLHPITCSDAIKNSGKASVQCTVLSNIYTNCINCNEVILR